MTTQEVAVGVCISWIFYVHDCTTEGVVIAADTTDGVPTTKGEGFDKLDPPSY